MYLSNTPYNIIVLPVGLYIQVGCNVAEGFVVHVAVQEAGITWVMNYVALLRGGQDCLH